jgi:REP element-mobilizing transposase RayT
MARTRKRDKQEHLFDERGRARVRNGKRLPQRRYKKRGRKPNGKRAGSPHKARPELTGRDPIHVVLRVVAAIGSLRKRHMYKGLREATIAVALRELSYAVIGAFRIVHISIQGNHVHLLVEADSKLALSRGMQSFQISAAKHLNRAVSVRGIAHGSRRYRQAMSTRRRGSVFPDRYHQEVITTPKQARHALSYVLNNWRKHKEDRHDFARTWRVDPYSTGALFDGWKELEHATTYWPLRDTYEPLVVYFPKTWLLREGWRKHGLIRTDEVPSERKIALVPRP